MQRGVAKVMEANMIGSQNSLGKNGNETGCNMRQADKAMEMSLHISS